MIVHRARTGIAAMIVAAVVLLPARADAQRPITPFTTGAIVEHRVSTTGSVERVVGAVWGAGASVTLSDWFAMRGRIAGGQLTARSADAEARSLAEADAVVILTPDRWIAVDAGAIVRSMETPLASQRWVELRTGGEAGLDLIDGMLRGTVRLSISPWVSVSGHPSPDLAVGAGTGLQYNAGRLAANLSYAIDRYDFPANGDARRLEQRSVLTARIGWRVR